jgi:hypothetical protein
MMFLLLPNKFHEVKAIDLNLTWVESFRVVFEGRKIDGPTLYFENQWHAKKYDISGFDNLGFFHNSWISQV